MDGYPVLNEDIYFAKLYNDSEFSVKIRNTTTEKDFVPTPDTVFLLELCTGTRGVPEIVERLSRRSGESPEYLTEGVTNILGVLEEKDIISINKTPLERKKVKKVDLKYPLETAQIEITNKCNLSCMHCFNNSGNPYPDELTTEEVLSVIDTLSSLGVYQVTFSGGEPLMHPDLYDIVEHARKSPMSVDIFTNGTLITEEVVEEFKALKIRRCNISVDSVTESIHDTFRGKKGALKKTLRGIMLLRESGIPFKLSICLSQLNKESITAILQYFDIRNQADFQIIPVRFSGRDVDGLAVSPEEYYEVLVEQLAYLKKEAPEGVFEFSKKTSGECSIARNTIGIKADGTILPCPACDREMGIGNIRDVDLAVMWEGHETLQTIRALNVNNDEKCSHCRYIPFCNGCVAGAFTIEGDLTCRHPYICALNMAYDSVFGLG
jgi:radical SAM protein with 4Fe4S-binding SPASM domain